MSIIANSFRLNKNYRDYIPFLQYLPPHPMATYKSTTWIAVMEIKMQSDHNMYMYMIRISFFHLLTHWGRVTHICVGKLTIIGSDNGLSSERRQAIIWPSAGILLIGPLGTNFSEILIGNQTFSFKKMYLKMSSAKWRPFVSASGREHWLQIYAHIDWNMLMPDDRHQQTENEIV